MDETSTTSYDHLSRDELLRVLRRQEAQRKFGLVWERPPAELDAAINEDFVALDLMAKLSEGDAPYENLVIEGDNFDALRALRATHAGRVKVICIDPPYNTGNKDFVYNDRYVDREHKFRHSLWIEFMYRRLVLARELLRDDGVMFVNIGEDEHAHLSMLMDQVFPGMKVGSFVWRTREGANDSGGAFFSQDHEYVLCYAGPRFRFGGQQKNQEHYGNPDNDPRGPWFGSDLTGPKNYKERPNSFYPVQDPNTAAWYPANPERVWAFASRDTKPGQKLRGMSMEELIADGRIIFPCGDRTASYRTMGAMVAAIRAGNAPSALREGLPRLEELVGKTLGFGRPKLKRFQLENRTSTKPLSSWIVATSASDAERAVVPDDANALEVSTNREATQAVNRILGEKLFSYPKPVSLYRALLEQATEADAGDIVLDFFAGSGTTGHAVLQLNAEDDGNRRFILVSNTEATQSEPDKNICRDVCRERVARVIRGYQTKAKGAGKGKRVGGLGGGFAYLRAVRLPMETVSPKLQHQWVWTALQLLHADSIQSLMLRQETKVLSLEDSDIVYLPDITEAAIEILRATFRRREAATVYSWRPGVLRQEFAREGVTFEKIPDALLARFGGRR